jgi:membrane-bound lytic murein transglycosylase B
VILGAVERLQAAILTIAALVTVSQLTRVLAASETVGPRQAAVAPADSPERVDFATFVAGLRTEALARGIDAKTVERALGGLEPSLTVIERDQTQAEVVLSVDEYVARRLTRSFVRLARSNAAKHKALLGRVSGKYGVPPRYLVAIWGLESNFGRFSGVRPTIQALATLAWEGRRGAFFRGELMNALEIVDRGYISLDQLRGSWAGAMGQTQFMPSSYLKWAEDFDADGDRDIWRSHPDVFASIANYLKAHGWSPDTTWGREVRLPPPGITLMREKTGMRTEGCRAEREMTTRLPLERWQALGVRNLNGSALPRVALDASLIHTGKRAFLVYGNYEALLKYNCAHSYALAVALLSEQIG